MDSTTFALSEYLVVNQIKSEFPLSHQTLQIVGWILVRAQISSPCCWKPK
jgi:hypothetical protein